MEKSIEAFLRKFPFLHRRLDPHMGEVVAGASVAFVLRGLGAGLGFLFNLLLAKRCGADGVGIYYLALAVVSVGTVFGRVGLDNTLLRFVASNAAILSWKEVKGVYSRGILLALVTSTFSAVVIYIGAPFIAVKIFHKPDLLESLRWMTLAIVPVSLLALYSQMLKGLRRIGASVFINGVGLSLFSVAALFFWKSPSGIQAGIRAYDLAAFLTLALGIYLWRLATPQLRTVQGSFKTKDLLKSSLPLFWVASMTLLIGWISTFTLGIWGTKQEVGVFGAATRTSSLISLVLLAVNNISAPKFAIFYKLGDLVALDSTAKKAAKFMTFFASPILVLILIFSDFIMGWFGPEFRAGATTLAILALGQFVNVATGSVGYILTMSGNERLARNRTFIVVFLSLALNLLLIPHFKLLGAAISSAICTAITNLISVYFVWSKLGIWTLPFSIKKRNKIE